MTEDKFLSDVLLGLKARPKTLPCKYFYDEAGSRLFEEICALEEYYPTRTERGILERHAGEMASVLPARTALIEYGSGNSSKTRILLEHAPHLSVYVPVDISCDHLYDSTQDLARRLPKLRVEPVCADYTESIELPPIALAAPHRSVFFPGSTIGNFEPAEVVAFLRKVGTVVGSGGSLIVGVDLQKDRATLEAAYNDRKGVTAAFNKNLLNHVNRELSADFDLAGFTHLACFDQTHGRIVMLLISNRPQTVHIGSETISFAEGEAITTEYSYKYTLDGFAELALKAGFQVRRVWMDENRWFSVQHLVRGA